MSSSKGIIGSVFLEDSSTGIDAHRTVELLSIADYEEGSIQIINTIVGIIGSQVGLESKRE